MKEIRELTVIVSVPGDDEAKGSIGIVAAKKFYGDVAGQLADQRLR
jgi:hypothetical protein